MMNSDSCTESVVRCERQGTDEYSAAVQQNQLGRPRSEQGECEQEIDRDADGVLKGSGDRAAAECWIHIQ